MEIGLGHYQFLHYMHQAKKPNRIRFDFYIKDHGRYFFYESTVHKLKEMYRVQKFLPPCIPRCLNINRYQEIMDKYSIKQESEQLQDDSNKDTHEG
jgi:endogenous inhibitor of DNA gyrase (YacG/DUF329 family)